MAETGNNLVVPKFKDKTTYYQSSLGLESSYPISASYKGILRLSPNDKAALLEDDTVEIFNEDVENISYRDSIDDVLETQFIRVSTSDGYLLDCRIGKFGVEFDNLYIAGPAKHGKIIVFTKDDKSFRLGGNTYLPVIANANASAQVESEQKITKDIVESNSQNVAHILVSHGTTERIFDYEEILETIDNAIVESLMDMQTEAVGSIHFFPISIQEYEKLLLKGRPNQFYCIQQDSSGNKVKNSPLIRDYLLCDGSLYKNIDFPELAKILDGEKIYYWDLDTKKNKYIKKEHINDYSKNKYFRVPDLRRMFLRSAYPDLERVGVEGNEVGFWEPDHRPEYPRTLGEDNHTHCITSAFFTKDYKKEEFKDVVQTNKEGNLAVTEEAAVLAPAAMVNWGGERIANNFRCPRAASDATYESLGYASYALSIPKDYNYQTRNIIANVGLSSENVSSVIEEPTKDSDLSYNALDEYVPYLSQTSETYGKENVPEFFCALPLIKI